MRYLKMLGLAAVAAAALTAFVGAGSASATVLCQSNTSPCTSPFEVGTEVNTEAGLTKLQASIFTVECEESASEGEITNEGGAGPVAVGLSSLSFSSCNGTVSVNSPGELELAYSSGTAADVTSSGASVSVTLFGVTCTYGTSNEPTKIGTLHSTSETGGNPEMPIEATIEKESGSFLCASNASWEGTYTVTNPSEGWASES